MSVDLAISTAWDIFKTWIAAPIGRQFAYVIFYDRYVEGLEEQVRRLEYEMQQVDKSVEAAVNNDEHIYDLITRWQESAKNLVNEAKERLEHEDKANKDACYCGILPNPKTRHAFSSMAKEKMGHIQRLLNERKDFKEISYKDAPPGIVAANLTAHMDSTTRALGQGGTINVTALATPSASNDDDVYESRAEVMRLVKNALADKNTNVVGVFGMGGVGKSTLLEEVEKQIREEELFDVVVKVNVSRTPDLKKIQEKIAHWLGLEDLKSKEDTDVRASMLHKKIQNDGKSKRILIILDNLWKGLDLKDVGVPCRYDNKVVGCKLLLTSRDRDVLRNDMCSDKEFLLSELKKEEAQRLFKKIVGSKVDDPEFKPLVDEVLQKCAGLPLLILSIAKSLKHGTPSTWRDFLKHIKVSSDEGIGAVIHSTIERSYDHLSSNDIKALFLTCGLVGISSIPIRDLLRYSMGMDLFGRGCSMEAARDRMQKLLDSLQASCLLLESDDSDIVKIHDLVREVAISIASKRDQQVLVMRNDDDMLEEWPADVLKNCSAISLPNVDIHELPEGLEWSKLKIFIIYSDDHFLKVPDSFFNSMEELKVLDLTNLCFTSLPSSMLYLENLQTLCLDNCCVEDVTILGKLRRLQVLSFMGSKLARLPKEVGELTELRLLDLSNCSKLETIEPGTLGSLVRLEDLYMEDSFDRWENEDKEAAQSNACLIELSNMAKLSTLDISIPDATALPKDLPFGKLNKYRIHIGDVWDWSGEYKESRTLKLKPDSSSIFLEEWVQATLQRTQDLYLDELKGIKKSVQELCMEGFQELKHLHVRDSPSIQYIVQSTDYMPSTAFTVLETLFIEELINLEKICEGCLTLESFSKLKVVKVESCDKLKNVFSLSLVKGLPQLEEIEVSNCNSMQEIIMDAGAEDDEEERVDVRKVELRALRRVTLQCLPEITSFCTKTSTSPLIPPRRASEITAENKLGATSAFFDGKKVLFPCLEDLTLSELPKVKEIWHNEPSLELSNLRSLQVDQCSFLLSVIKWNLLLKLMNLESLTIKSCQHVQEVFDLRGLKFRGNISEVLPRLTEFNLSDLPSLRCIWNENPGRILTFQNLKWLKVQNCNNLKFLFSSSVAKALLQVRRIQVVNCMMMEEIILEEEGEDTTDIIVFPLLTFLSLEELPNLRTFSRGQKSIDCSALKRLKISGCPKMRTFSSYSRNQEALMATYVDSKESFSKDNVKFPSVSFFNEKVLLPSLEELLLSSMANLESIWHSKLSEKSFCRLASITIEKCNNLLTVFSSCILERMENLRKLVIAQCNSLGVIFEWGVLNTKKKHKPLMLSGLKEVKLRQLPKLRHFLKSDSKVLLGFPSLTAVYVRNCHNLIVLFPHPIVRTLDKLETVDISFCSNMHEVIADDEGGMKKSGVMKFRHLSSLKLCNLKSLHSFSSGSSAYDFPSLKNLSIMWCTQLKGFIFRPVTLSIGKPMENVEDKSKAEIVEDSAQPLFDEKVTFPNLEELQIAGIELKELWHSEVPAESFGKLKLLEVKRCVELSYVVPSFMLRRLHYLESLTVEACSSMECIYELKGLNSTGSKSGRDNQLTNLSLTHLPSLICIWKHDSQADFSFQNLSSLKVWECKHLRNLFTLSIANNLEQLQELDIYSCEELEVIVAKQTTGFEETIDKIVFAKLYSLELHTLPKLSSFCRWKHILECPSLKKIDIKYCEAVKVIAADQQCYKGLDKDEDTLDVASQLPLFLFEKVSFPSLENLVVANMDNLTMLWSGEASPDSFNKLTDIEIESCEELLNIIPSNMLLNFQNLERLTVSDCNSMEVIYDLQGLIENTNTDATMMAPRLSKLTLDRLAKLKHIWSRDTEGVKLTFGNLDSIHVGECESLEYLFPASVSESLLKLDTLEVITCGLEEIVAAKGEEETSVPHFVFPQVSYVKFWRLAHIKSLYPGRHTSEWPLLKQLVVYGCDSIEVFASYLQTGTARKSPPTQQPLFYVNEDTFPVLEELRLEWNDVMEEVWNGQFYTNLFGKLQVLELICFHEESAVFPFSFLQQLQNIDKLTVRCSSFNELFQCQGPHTKEKHPGIGAPLRKLELSKLNNLTDIWKGNCEYCSLARNLENIEVSDCAKLTSLLPSMVSFPNLTSLEVSQCNELKTLLTLSTAKSLRQLNRLSVIECDALTEIVTDGSGYPKGEVTLSQLSYLKLQSLLNFSCFSSGSYILKFPLLEEVIMSKCPNMKTFSKGVLFAPRLEKVWITEDEDWRWADDLNTTVEQLFTEKVALYSLENLKISESPEWKETWQGHIPFGSLNKLKSLTLEKCEFLVIAISSDKFRLLKNLEVLDVRNCDLLEVVFQLKGVSTAGHQKLLSHLNELSLRELPQLKHIWDGDFSGLSCFKSLKTLGIYNCSSLRYIMSTSMTLDLPQLEKIEIKDCNVLEEVFINEKEEDDETKGLKFPLLDSVVLDSLPNLISFYSGNGVLECRILKTISIANCPKMNTFISPFLKKKMLEMVDESEKKSLGKGEIHFPATPFFSEKVLFPSLEQMTLSCLDNLKTIWHEQLAMELKTLEILKVADCNSIEEIFSFGGPEVVEKGDAMIDMSLKEIELCRLSNLKHLWNGDLKGMVGFQNLETVHVWECNKLKNLFPASIARGLLQLDKLDIQICGLEEIIAKGEEEITKFVFPQTTYLKFWRLPELKSFYPGIHSSEWPLLKEMVIYGCDQMEAFASEVQIFHQTALEKNLENPMKQPLFLTEKVAFPKLENLRLDWNDLMKEVWQGQIPAEVFPKLKVLELINFVDKSAVFPNALLPRLQNLEKLVVSSSYFKDMTLYGGVVYKEQGTTRMTPTLRELKLELLSEMTQLCSENIQGDAFQNLEILEVSKCHRLKSLVQSSISLQSLTDLEVSTCQGLISLMTSSTAKSLVHLVKLNVTKCENMKKVVESEGAAALDVIAFSRLKHLKLDSLPELGSFFSGNSTIELPLLEEITVTQCPRMRIFSNGALSTPKLASLIFAGEEIALLEGNINAGIQKSFEEMAAFPSIEQLKLSEFPEWIAKWDQFPVKSSCSLKSLVMDKCSSLSCAIFSNLVQFLDKLEVLDVRNCDALKGVFDLDMHEINRDSDQVAISLLSQISKIYLINLPRLRQICNQKQQGLLDFGNLKLLEVNNCSTMEHLFPCTLAFSLPQLQELKIKNCSALKDIISEEVEHEVKSAKDKIMIPRLRSILLESLPNLASFYDGSLKLECPSLKSIRLVDCSSLTTFVATFSKEYELLMGDKEALGHLSKDESKISGTALFNEKVVFPGLETLVISRVNSLEMIWDDQLRGDTFNKLKSMKVEFCEKLLNIFPFGVLGQLRSLETLIATDCNSLEAVFKFPLFNSFAKDDAVGIPLKGLDLYRLPNLQYVWDADPQGTVAFQNLSTVRIFKCQTLKNLFPASVARNLMQLEELLINTSGIADLIGEEEVQETSNFVFPKLTSVKFLSLPELKNIYPGMHTSCWPSLKTLKLYKCDKVEILASDVASFQEAHKDTHQDMPIDQPLFLMDKVEFPNMESMVISHMKKLISIWKRGISPDAFCKLKTLLAEFCDGLPHIFPYDTVECFQNLEMLTVTDCGSLQEVFQLHRLNLKETNSVTALQMREMVMRRLPKIKHIWNKDPQGTLKFEKLQKVEAYECQMLGNLFPFSVGKGLTQLKELLISSCAAVEEIVSMEDGVDTTASFIFPQLTSLKLFNLPQLKSFYPHLHTSEWPLLKELRVYHCDKFMVFSESHGIKTENPLGISHQQGLFSVEKIIPNLEALTLFSKDALMIRDGHFPEDIFSKLKTLFLVCFHDEKAVFPSSFLIRRFNNLKKLVVSCSSFEEIFSDDPSGQDEMTISEVLAGEGKPVRALGSLTVLRLFKLHNVKHVWKEDSLAAEILQNIRQLYTGYCNSLTILFPSSATLKNLIVLEVEKCSGLKHLMMSSAARSLVQLTKMSITECNAIEEVVSDDGDIAGGEEVRFPKLKHLGLHCLASLMSFSSTKCSFVFPCLEVLIVRQCPKMNIFSDGDCRTPKLDKVLSSEKDEKGRWGGDLNTTIQKFSS